MYREIQSGAVAKSYMRKGILICEEMLKYFPIYEEAVSHIWLVQLLHSKFSFTWEKLIFFFITEASALIYRPSFRENKPKTLVLYDWKRAYWACFRENWVYKFGHWTICLPIGSQTLTWTIVNFLDLRGGGGKNVPVSTAGLSILNNGIFWQEAKTKRLISQWGGLDSL